MAAKRFTDSGKWKRPWFSELPVSAKLLWFYILDDADHCGIWHAVPKRIQTDVGEPYTFDEIEHAFGDKLVRIESGRYFIPSFVTFQYGPLKEASNVHASVLKELQRLGFTPEGLRELGIEFASDAIAGIRRISQKKRQKVFTADNYTCTYCGRIGDGKTLEVDHILPRVAGGTNDDENLTTACLDCNARKGDQEVHQFVERGRLLEKLSPRLLVKLQFPRGKPAIPPAQASLFSPAIDDPAIARGFNRARSAAQSKEGAA